MVITIEFDNNRYLPLLFGQLNCNINYLASCLDITIGTRGNVLSIKGEAKAIRVAEQVLLKLEKLAQESAQIDKHEVDIILNMVQNRPKSSKLDNNKLNSKSKQIPDTQESETYKRGREDMLWDSKESAVKERQVCNKQSKRSKQSKSQNLEIVYKSSPDALSSKASEGDLSEQDKAIEEMSAEDNIPAIVTNKFTINAKSPGQMTYIRALEDYEIVFGVGVAGTGKTYLAVAMAVKMFLAGEVDRIILTRPVVESGEQLGFLPGDLKEKIDPYMRPIYDVLYALLTPERVSKLFATGDIELAPLAYMRGRSLNNAYIILDEAQNTTTAQMQMFLTRMGKRSRMVITGDLSQIDLPSSVNSGLQHCSTILQDIAEIKFIYLNHQDVIRNKLVEKIIQAYDCAS